MMRIFVGIILAAFLAVSVCSTAAIAADPKARLTEIKREMASLKFQNEQDIRKVNKECDDAIVAAKDRFHKERSKALEDKKNKLARIEDAFRNKMRPLEIEEKELLKIVAPEQANFAKKRSD